MNRKKSSYKLKNIKISDISSNEDKENWQDGYPSYNSPEDIKELYKIMSNPAEFFRNTKNK
jgi:hypothetical protein